MDRFILISVVCMQLGWISGAPKPEGVGVFAYQDSNGNRYGGTYGLSDDQVRNIPGLHSTQGSFTGPDQDHFMPVPFGLDFDDFFPEYFRNFEKLLQEAFNSNKEYQRKALESAKKAYDITSNQAGFMNFDLSRFAPYNGLNSFAMPNFGQNAAYAAGAAMPGMSHQIAAINPGNPNQPNVNIVNRFAEDPNNRGFMSVSSTSYSTSSNVNGHEVDHRGAETVVNNNGVVHHYKVES